MSATTKDVAQVKRGTSFLRLKRDHVKKDRPSKDAPGDASTTSPTSPSSSSPSSSSSSSLPAVPEDPAPDGEIIGPASGGGGDGSVGRAGGVGLVEQLLAEADRKRFKLREVEDKRASMMGSMAPISLRDPPPTRFASSDALPPPSATTSPSPSSSSSSSSLAPSSSPRSTSVSNLSGAAGDRHTFVRSPFADAGRHVAPGPGAGAPALPPKRVGGGVAHSLPAMTSVAALKQQPSPRSNNGLHHEIDSATTTTSTTRSSSPGSSPRVSPPPSSLSSEAAVSSLASSQSLLVSSPRSGEAVDPVLQQQRLRQQVVEELVNTETDYVRDLKLILSVFYMPLKSRGILGNAELQSIFSNLSVLLNVNEQLERALADMRAKKDDKVGHIFLETADYFKMYTQYCANQENCIRTMDLLEKKNKPFAKFLDECAENPATRSLSFNAFLIKPIQRICKYPLLLRELLKYTPEEHPDHAQAKAALEKVQGVVEEVNKKKRDSENLQKILEIQGQISNISELGQSLVKPGRQFLREMTCSKISSQGKTQERHLFLFSDLLVFASSTLFQQKISEFKSTIKGKASVSNSRKIYLYKSAIPLKRCSAWSIPDTDTAQHGFEILLMDGDKKIVTLYCKTADEKDEWLAHMTERVKFYQDKANNKKQDGAAGTVKLAAPSALSQSHIPVVPDDSSSSSSLSAPLPRPKKITGKTRTRLPTQMFEGADLVLTGDDQQPASPRSGSSSPSSASASPAGSLIGGMVGHDDAPATTMVGPFVVASSSSQSVAVRPLLSSGSLIVSGSHAVLPNTVASRDTTEADAVLCDLQSSSSTSRSRKDRRAPVLLEKRSLDVEMERIEASSSHDHLEPVPDHAAASAEPRQPLSRAGSGIVPVADGHNRLRGNTLEPGAGAAALPSPSSADGASPRGTTASAASDLVSPRRATLSTATAVPPLRASSGTLSAAADNGPTPSPGSGGSSSSAARSPRRTFSCHPSPAPSDPAAAAAASTPSTAAAAGPPPSPAATPSPGSGGPSSAAAAGRGRAPPPPSTASKPRFTMTSGGGGGKPPVVGTTNPLPLAAFGQMAEPAPFPSSPSSSSLPESPSPPPSGGSSSTSAPSSPSPSSTLSPPAGQQSAAAGSGDAGFRSRVSYYTPNPITDDASTTTSRATRPRGGPRGRGRG